MKAWVGIAAVAAAWLARGGSPDAEVELAKAEAPVDVASDRVASGRVTTVGPTVPRLELPIEPPALVDDNPALPAADPRTIHGAIYELGGDPCVGATVVATSPALEGEQVVIADENGLYRIGALPPGAYTLVVYYNDQWVSVAGYEVRDDEATLAELVFDPPPREVVAHALDCPDGGCTIRSYRADDNTENIATPDDFADDLAITLDNSSFENIPVPGRTFETVLGAAAGSQPGG